MSVAMYELEDARLPSLPALCYYVPDFISEAEEARMLSQIRSSPGTRWTQLSHRRLLSVPSSLTGTARDTLLSASLPTYLSDPIIPRFQSLGLFAGSPHKSPNHVLINEYQPGQGIMPHEDGPTYHPCTATVSLGAPIVLEVYEKSEMREREAEPTWRILQEPRSLLVTTGDMYKDTLHGIAEVEVDEDITADAIVNWEQLGDRSEYGKGRYQRRERLSLTYRDVLKVAKVGSTVKFLGKR